MLKRLLIMFAFCLFLSKLFSQQFTPVLSNHTLCIEAEAPSEMSNMSPITINTDLLASGGKFLMLPLDIPGNTRAIPTDGHVKYEFIVPKPTHVYIWIRAIYPTPNNNSFWYTMDSNPTWKYLNLTPHMSNWTWKKINYFDLTAGKHTLEFAYRERGTKLDKILITEDASFTPYEFGCDLSYPFLFNALKDTTLHINSHPIVINLNEHFTDLNGGSLTYSFSGQTPDSMLSIKDNRLRINPLQSGTYQIIIKAIDKRNQSRGDTVIVKVQNKINFTGSTHCFEAENPINPNDMAPMLIYDDASASGSKYIMAPPSSKIPYGNYNLPQGHVKYAFTLPQASNIYPFLRVICPDGSHNSFFVRFNDGPWKTSELAVTQTWAWRALQMVSLPAGDNVMEIVYREKNTKLDKIFLSKNVPLTPVGKGCETLLPKEEKNINDTILNVNSGIYSLHLPDYFTDPTGGELAFTVSSAPATNQVSYQNGVLRFYPSQTGTVSITIQATTVYGQSISKSFTCQVHDTPALNSYVYCFEAENPSNGTFSVYNFQIFDDAMASNGKYIMNSYGNYPSSVPSNEHVKYEFTIDKPAKICAWLRVICSDSHSDSFWLRFDNEAWCHWNPNRKPELFSEWSWQRVNPGQLLSPGVHTLEIACREKNTKLDKILLTQDNLFVPKGTGCNFIYPHIIQPLNDTTVNINSGRLTINLNEYFIDANGGNLSYHIKGENSDITIENEFLHFNPVQEGIFPVTLEVRDRYDVWILVNFNIKVQNNTFVKGYPLCIEAENWINRRMKFRPLKEKDDPLASGGKYIEAAPNDFMSYTSSSVHKRGHARYEFYLTEETTVYPWLRVQFSDIYSDSFWYRIDEDDFIHFRQFDEEDIHSNWRWEPAPKKTLPVGRHVIEIAYREKNSKLDKFLLTDNAKYVPRSLGCAGNTSESFSVDIEAPATKVCPNAAVRLNAIVTGGEDVVSHYLWKYNDGTVICSGYYCDNIMIYPTDNVDVILTVTKWQQSVSKAIHIQVVKGIDLEVATKACKGSDVQLIASGPDKFYWTPLSAFNCQGCSDPVIENIQDTIQGQVQSAPLYGGCVYTKDFEIVATDYPRLSSSNDEYVMCNAGGIQSNITIENSDGIQYSWYPTDGVSNPAILNPVFSPQISTTYTLTATNAAGCKAYKDIFIQVPKLKTGVSIPMQTLYQVEKGQEITVCLPENVDTLYWTNSQYIVSQTGMCTTFRLEDSHSNNLVIMDNGCGKQQQITFEVYTLPQSNFTYQAIQGLSVQFIPTHPSTNYLWEFGDGQTSTASAPVHIFPSEGEYLVCLTQTGVRPDNQNYSIKSCQYITVKEIKSKECCD